MRAALTKACNRAVKAAWGQVVTYQPKVGGSETLRDVFDEAYEVVQLGEGEVTYAGSAPTLLVVLADMAQPPVEGDRWTVDGVTYEVVAVHPDGHGGAALIGART